MKTVLITGCSSGFGLEIARHFLARDWQVVATMRTPRNDVLPPSEHLRVLAWVADHYFGVSDYRECQRIAARVLSYEPTREDAHRLLMRCFVRVGERAQALRQFRICAEVLRLEFDTTPEHETVALFEQLRLAPADV